MTRILCLVVAAAWSTAAQSQTSCAQVGASNDLIGVVLFGEGNAAVRDIERSRLSALLQFAMKSQYNRLLIVGHADEEGSEVANETLGRKRAATVKAILMPVAGQIVLDAVTCGEAKPVLPASGGPHPHNRRVEIRGVR